jgi:tetratricopeptide (TPR) repeat protein
MKIRFLILFIIMFAAAELFSFTKKKYSNYDSFAVRHFLNGLYYENYLDRNGAVNSFQSAQSISSSDNIRFNIALQYVLSGAADNREKGESLLYELFNEGYPLGRFGIYLYLSDKKNKSYGVSGAVLDSVIEQAFDKEEYGTAAIAEKQKLTDKLFNFTSKDEIERFLSVPSARPYPKMYRMYYSSLMVQLNSQFEYDKGAIEQILSTLEEEYPDTPYLMYRFVYDEYIFQKDYEAAGKILDKMNRITLGDIKYFSDNADFLMKTGDFTGARNILLDGIAEYPESALPLELAALYLNQQDYEKAEIIYGNFLNKYPDSDFLYRRMTGDYSAHGNFAKTAEIFEKALSKFPEDAEMLNNYAYIMAQNSKDLEKALDHVTKALLQQPQSISFLDTKAWILFKMGKHEDAEVIMDALFAGEDAFFHSSSDELFGHHKEIKAALGKSDDLKDISVNSISVKLSEIMSKSDYILQLGIE